MTRRYSGALLITPSELDGACTAITELFIRECTRPDRLPHLPPHVYACGQYFGQAAPAHRGIHGTAAAISVLAQSPQVTGASQVLQGLLTYVTDRVSLEQTYLSSSIEDWPIEQRLLLDSVNTVKVAELAQALSRLSTHSHSKVRNILLKLLLSGQSSIGGWSHFLDRPQDVQFAPTAIAVISLTQATSPRTASARAAGQQYLLRHLPALIVSDPMLASLVMYSLARDPFSGFTSDLNPLFRKLWVTLGPSLTDPTETTIRYWRDNRQFYMLVPWQLYLTGIAAAVDPFGSFVSRTLQAHLHRICQTALHGGLRYPQTGDLPSTRTNAILFDILRLSANDPILKRRKLLLFAHARQLSHVASGQIARVALLIVGCAIAGLALAEWIRGGNDKLAAVAPELIAAVLIWAVAGLRRGRR
jgi:hypothetical protein